MFVLDYYATGTTRCRWNVIAYVRTSTDNVKEKIIPSFSKYSFTK